MSARALVGAAFALLAAAPAALSAVGIPTSDFRALEVADLACGSGVSPPLDASALPFDDEAWLEAYDALRAVGLRDPIGEALRSRAAAYRDGQLHLEPLKPTLSARLSVFGGAEERLVSHGSGETLREGVNTFLSASGSAYWLHHLGGVYDLGLHEEPGDLKYRTKRLYLQGTLGKWSFKLGRDAQRLGPGYHGSLLLDDNAPTLDLWRVRTEEPLVLPGFLSRLGGVRFTLFNAYLSDSNPSPPDPRYGSGVDGVKDPGLFGMRFSLHPTAWLDAGLSRTALYGGEGRQTYRRPKDWWELFSGLDENVHEGESHRYDNDQYASIDLTVRLPFLDGLGLLRGGKVYWEYGGADFIANWKSGSGTGSWWMPFKFDDVGNLGGMYLSTAVTDFRAEYAQTSRAWYRNGQYPQGYSYQGFPLGHHMGGDARDFFVQAGRYFGPEWRVALGYDWEERGRSEPEVEKRSEASLTLEAYGLKVLGMPCRGRIDGLIAEVRSPWDDPQRDDRTEWTLGLGLDIVP